MPTRWPSYILVIFTAFLGWIAPTVTSWVWGLFAGSRHGKFAPKNPKTKSNALNLAAEPISVRFHLAALLFLGFLGFIMILIPLLYAVRSEGSGLSSFLIFAVAVSMTIILFYCLRKGDLSWNLTRARELSSDRTNE